MKKPFFSKFLEHQTKSEDVKGGVISAIDATTKHPSDTDEDIIIDFLKKG